MQNSSFCSFYSLSLARLRPQRGRLVAFRARLICLHSGASSGNAPPMPRWLQA